MATARIRRFQIGLNVFTQLLVVIALAVMINYVGFRQYKRWDFSRNQKFELSPMTTGLLNSLEKPVRATVFFNADNPVAKDVELLMKEYKYASKGRFSIEVVDPFRNMVRARELATLYKFNDKDDIVILDYNGRKKFVTAAEMAEFTKVEAMAAVAGQEPRLKSFKGEQAITSALLQVTEEKPNKVYLIAGHGEPELKGGTLATFQAYAERQNLRLDTLRLTEVDKIPEDASALIMMGARADYSEREMQLVNEFWSKNGRLFVALDPEGRTPRLNAFLLINAVAPSNDRVLRTGTGVGAGETQQLELRTIVIDSPVTGVYTESGRFITKDLAGIDTGLLGPTQSFQIDKERSKTQNLRVTPLIESTKNFWGETEYGGPKDIPYFDPKRDHMGPLTVATALEKGALDDSRVKVDTSRMIVVGNAHWLTNDGLRLATVGVDFSVNCLNWLLNREQLLGIPPKAKEPVRLDLTTESLFKLALTVIVFIPGTVAVLGFAVWLIRRA